MANKKRKTVPTRDEGHSTMITHTFQNKDDWFAARRGKITGSRVKDIIAKDASTHKIGFFELIAEQLSTDPYGAAIHETPMERGTRLEPEAIERFKQETKLDVDGSLVMWMRKEDEGIAISPDGFIGTELAVETKCLSSARHIEAFLTKFMYKKSDVESIPGEYKYQAMQYFIVNDDLKTLYFVFYDPRVTVKDYFALKINREDWDGDLERVREYQKKELKEAREAINFMSF